jgi:hypothetical protein
MDLLGFFSKSRKKESREADALGAFPQLARASAKESAKASQGGMIISRLRLIESEANPVADSQNPSRFRVVLIQEGLGNFGDCHFYSRQALDQAVQAKIFEGAKCFANHPTAIEEQVQPERSVRDIIGHFENIALSIGSDGRAQIVGDLVILPGDAFDWVRALFITALDYAKKYPGQDLVGLSINASGDADEVGLNELLSDNELPESVKPKLADAATQGVTSVKLVSQLTSAVSCDLVTEAGAGGKIAQMLEQERARMKIFKTKEAKKEAEGESTEGKKEGGAQPGAAPAQAGAEDPESDPDHADADQDDELIRQELLKYLGDGHDDETVETFKQAIGAGKELGMDDKEAMQAAGNAMKLSKHMASKAAPAPAAAGDAPTKPAPGATTTPTEAEAEEKKEAGDPTTASSEAKKETAKAIKLAAENAKLKETIKGYELNGCEGLIEKKLRESKISRHATKLFRESAGAIKSETDFEEKFKIFKEAYSARGGEADLLENFIVTPERQTHLRESGGLDLSDCVKKD